MHHNNEPSQNNHPSHQPSANDDLWSDEFVDEMDCLSHFTLCLIADAVKTPSLELFLQQTAADPLVCRILLTRDAGEPYSHAITMSKAAGLASTNAQIEASEKEAVYAATLIARVGAAITTGTCAHRLHRRWRYLRETALVCLARSDPANGLVMRLALGLGRDMDVNMDRNPGQDITRCARLQSAVHLAWIQANAWEDKHPLALE